MLSVLLAGTGTMCLAQADEFIWSNHRLFFSHEQRIQRSTENNRAKSGKTENDRASPVAARRAGPQSRLMYNGYVGVNQTIQIIINGVPWHSGDDQLKTVRVLNSGNRIEVQLANGRKQVLSVGQYLFIP